MDFATLIGLILGVSLVVWSMLLGGPLLTFWDTPSVVMVFGGTAGVVLMSFTTRQVLGVFKVLKNVFFHKPTNPLQLIKDLVKFAEVARRDGILALENVVKDHPNKFLVSGIQMAVDGNDPALIESILTGELEVIADRHSSWKAVLDCMGKYGPAFGMIGTLVGLVIMLKNMSDPSAIGPGMAVAILTTFYGAVISNMFTGPFGDKLALRSNEELLLKSIIIKGVMSIQSGDNPRVVEQKLKIYLPPNKRSSILDAKK